MGWHPLKHSGDRDPEAQALSNNENGLASGVPNLQIPISSAGHGAGWLAFDMSLVALPIIIPALRTPDSQGGPTWQSSMSFTLQFLFN